MKLRAINTEDLIKYSRMVQNADKNAKNPIGNINELYSAVSHQIKSRDRLIVELTKIVIDMNKRDKIRGISIYDFIY